MTRPKVYLSSTYRDLIDYRRSVYDQMRKMRFDVIGMEDYVASDERPLERCLADVAASDYYVGIIARRYGYVPTGEQRSITELEYRQAAAEKIPTLIFLLRDDAPWPQADVESGPGQEQLARFRADLGRDHLVSYFAEPNELAAQVSAALFVAKDERIDPMIEDLRRRRVAAHDDRVPGRPQRVVNLAPIDVQRFRDRREQQQELRRFLDDRSIRLVTTVGRAGLGKSALATHVLGELSGEADGALDGLMYLSSGTTGLGLDRIYADGGRILGDAIAETLRAYWARKDVSLPSKVDHLIESMRDGSYVILLDGLERALDEDRNVAEEGLRIFIEACLRSDVGPRLVVTSRTDPVVAPDALRTARTIRLNGGLAADDAIELLRDLDPQGDLGLRDAPDELLAEAVDQTGGIPRALEIVAGILHQDSTTSLRRLLEEQPTLRSKTVERVVADGYDRLDEDQRRVMEVLAVFDGPVDEVAITYVLHTWFPGIGVRECLRELAAGYYVTVSRATGEYRLQPLDREHAYAQIPERADAVDTAIQAADYTRRALELRVADLYASLRRPAEEWRSLDDLEPQIAEFEHSARAGDADRALEVLAPIDQDHLFLWGHYALIMDLRGRVVDLPARDDLRADNLESLALCAQVTGDNEGAIGLYRRAIELGSEGDRASQGRRIGNLGRLHRNLGDLDEAIRCTDEALRIAKELGNRRDEGFWSDRLGLANRSIGKLDDAVGLHRDAIAIAREVGDERGVGAGLSNLGLVMLVRGDTAAAMDDLRESYEIAVRIGDRRGEAIRLGRLGRAYLDTGDTDEAAAHHRQALVIAREIGDRREESYQLLGLGRAALDRAALQEAEQHLRAALRLDVVETSYLAALALALTGLRGRAPWANGELERVVRLAEDLLARCELLYAVRYSFAIARLGLAATDPRWLDDVQRPLLLGPVVEEFDAALRTCAAAGVVRSALADVAQLELAGLEHLETIQRRLEGALETPPHRSEDGS